MSDLADTIFFHADSQPDKPAVITTEGVLTYGTLRRGILSAQQHLQQAGLKAGDLVALAVNNAIGHVTLICALYRSGMTSVSIDGNQMDSLNDMTLAALLTNYAEPKSPIKKIVVDDTWFEGTEVYAGTLNAALTRDQTSPCRLILSSGTTGQPKIIALSFGALAERLISYAIRVSTPSWDRMLCLPGLSTNYGYSFAMTALWLGRTICFSYAGNPRQIILANQVEVLIASTHQIAAMVQYQEQSFQRLDSLRAVHIGGAVAYAPLLVRIRMLICNNVYCGYGSTEGGTVAYAAAEAVFGIDRAVGITAPWVTMEVVDEQNKLQDYGNAGQVRLRALGQGYRYRKKDDGYDIEEADWFYPGDQGTLYRNGLLLILGRVNELINRGGVKVAPDTIEEEMKKHPAVADAAAVSVLDPVGIEQIWVAIVSSDGSEINVTTMYEHCRTQMPLYVPDRIFQVQSIPRNQLGKVSRVPLSEQLKALESSHVLALR